MGLMNTRYYRIGGITLRLESDRPFREDTFAPEIECFRASRPGRDTVRVRLHFSLPGRTRPSGLLSFRKPPWAIYGTRRGWTYVGISRAGNRRPHMMATFDRDHSIGDIYVPNDRSFRRGGLGSLTMLPTDQILLARLLADRRGVLLHAAGAVLGGRGLLFLGHSAAGKSTVCGMLAAQAGILCDDRTIARRHGASFGLYGTWSHGTCNTVSSASAPLAGLFFITKSRRNAIHAIDDRGAVVKRLLPLVIKPLVTAAWWRNTLDTLEDLAARVPAYVMEFDQSGGIVPALRSLSDAERRRGRA